MITEIYKGTVKSQNGKTAESTMERFVEITGADLPKFAVVLRGLAVEAREKGEVTRASFLENQARRCDRGRKFKCKVPLDQKLHG